MGREREEVRKKERKEERERETQSHNSAPRRDEAGKMRISQALNYVHSGTGTEEFNKVILMLNEWEFDNGYVY